MELYWDSSLRTAGSETFPRFQLAASLEFYYLSLAVLSACINQLRILINTSELNTFIKR